MHVLMRVLTKTLEALYALYIDSHARTGVQDREVKVLHMSRAQTFWRIVWEYHFSLLHHEAHDIIYLIASGPKSGSLRSAVIDCLIVMRKFVDCLIG